MGRQLKLFLSTLMLIMFATVANAALTVHFIDVGQADAMLIRCDGQNMLIDGGNREDSSKVYSFLKSKGVTKLAYVINTHPHEDHVGGIPGALQLCPVNCVYAREYSHDSRVYTNFVNARARRGRQITIPANNTTFKLGGAKVRLFNPSADYGGNTSIVTKVTYGKTSFLFTGDMEDEQEHWLMNTGANLRATVLKVGHHGSRTSTGYVFLRNVMPKYAVISVGKNNSYGHPSSETLSKLRDEGAKVFRTDMQGDITCVSNGKKLTWTTKRNSGATTNSTGASRGYYAGSSHNKASKFGKTVVKAAFIGNSSSNKFHRPGCSYMPQPQNQVAFKSRAEAIKAGYEPCKRCNP